MFKSAIDICHFLYDITELPCIQCANSLLGAYYCTDRLCCDMHIIACDMLLDDVPFK